MSLDDPEIEAEAAEIVTPVNQQALTYLSQNYPQFGSTSMVDINDPNFTYFAEVYNVAEGEGLIVPTGNSTPTVATQAIPAWVTCVSSIVSGFFSIEDLIKGLGTFEFGTVWTVVKFAIKKYAGWFAAAVLIYEVATNCF
jgi:hypothetical protein